MRILLFLAMFVVHGSLFAQGINKGSVMVGGGFSVGVRTFKFKEAGLTSSTQVYASLYPFVNKFIKNDFALGGGLGYQYNSTLLKGRTGLDSIFGVSNTYSILPAVTYYKFFTGKLGLFGRAGIPLSYRTYSSQNSVGQIDNQFSSYRYGINITPGICFMPNKHWFISTTIGGIGVSNGANLDSSGKESSGDFTADISFTFQNLVFSIAYIFNNNKEVNNGNEE